MYIDDFLGLSCFFCFSRSRLIFLFTFLSQYRILHRFTYGLHARGPRCNIYRCSVFDPSASPSLIDLRWFAPRLVTLVNSMDSFYTVYRSLFLSLFFVLSSRFILARGADHNPRYSIKAWKKWTATTLHVTRLVSHVAHRSCPMNIFMPCRN